MNTYGFKFSNIIFTFIRRVVCVCDRIQNTGKVVLQTLKRVIKVSVSYLEDMSEKTLNQR